MTLNYDVASTFASGQTGATGSADLRSFAPWGIVNSDWLGFAGTLRVAPARPRQSASILPTPLPM